MKVDELKNQTVFCPYGEIIVCIGKKEYKLYDECGIDLLTNKVYLYTRED